MPTATQVTPNPTPSYAGIPGQQAWNAWAAAVLTGIGAPLTQDNYNSLWAWTWREKPHNDIMQWNNPLNVAGSTYPGATCAFVIPNSGGDCVNAWPTADAGAQATIQRLQQNPAYGAIVQMLKAGTPASEWSAQAQQGLSTWSGGGYSSLDPSGAGSAPLGTNTPQGSGSGGADKPTCAHSTQLGPLGQVCWDKPLAVVEIAGGAIIMLVGAVILGVALISGAFPGVRQAAETAFPVTRAVKAAGRVRAAQRASQGRRAATSTRSATASVREARAAELHTLRVQQTRARVSAARANARNARARARAAGGRGEFESGIRGFSPEAQRMARAQRAAQLRRAS